ncbi:hypothetical protein [Pseudomonas sp. 6D_7.1_Bac1]|uniref:hypothetical protein n=1 Tax=Pseudomonas sp. 6D_7.1_Bac1 TaxID=2971615 RepID=UPI0021CA4A95|nr:hypothetical protein [Pseudomonas sp. 6D_7.1_Bac1]MCU1751299.1 hypothetical protein [Pseudomonas sp. 6D_7.1_Bac1]
MSYKEVLDGSKISISISESESMPALGLSHAHLVDAMCEAARHMLALGATVTYGGDLRTHGFTRILYELVCRYRKDSCDNKNLASVINYLAWPVFMNSDIDALFALSSEMEGTAEIKVIDEQCNPLSLKDASSLMRSSTFDWSSGLTAMRRIITAESTARIVLGGKTSKFNGSMPGIAEEVLISLQSHKPVYLLGGFGGCTREILDLMGVDNQFDASLPCWPYSDEFKQYKLEDLRNGLTTEENTALANTPHIDQAIILVIRGLMNIHADNQVEAQRD